MIPTCRFFLNAFVDIGNPKTKHSRLVGERQHGLGRQP